MTHMTEQEFDKLQSKSQSRRLAIQEQDEPEATLSKDVRKWANDLGYPAQVLRQTKRVRGLIPPGWTDAVIALPKGKTLWCELKVPGKGRMSDDQKLMAQQLLTLEHLWHEVRTWKQFLEITSMYL